MANTVSRIISDETLSRIIQIESAGNPNARAGTSSATGLGQFLNGTWIAELKQHRPDLFNGPPYDDELALRTDPTIAIEMLAYFTEDNARELGYGYTDGDLYLAHFAGAGTARKCLRASPDSPASTVFSQAAIVANRSILDGKNCGQVRAWAARRMAASGATNWVAKLYRGNGIFAQPVAMVADDTAPAVQVDDVPLPPEAPARPNPPLADDERVPFFKRFWRRITGYAGAGGVGLGTFAWATDWRVVAVIVGALMLSVILVGLVMGPNNVRNFIRRQFIDGTT